MGTPRLFDMMPISERVYACEDMSGAKGAADGGPDKAAYEVEA